MWCLGWVVEALVFVRCAFGCRPILLEMLRSMSYKLQVESKHWTELRNLLLQTRAYTVIKSYERIGLELLHCE